MSPIHSPNPAFRNMLLSRLPEQDRATLLPHLVPMELPVSLVLVSPDTSGNWVYLLERGLTSMSASTADGKAVEIGLIGREGVVGVSALLGHRPLSHTIIMQGTGHGYRMEAGVFRQEMLKRPVLLQGVHDAIYMQLASFAQSGVCKGMHEVEARLSRWLLTAADFMETETMDLTQEFLSLMLGTQRTSVSAAAGTLQRRGLIRYQRGHLTILDRAMLEKAACDCYGVLREAYQRIFFDRPSV